jgi:hypothetical protein
MISTRRKQSVSNSAGRAKTQKKQPEGGVLVLANSIQRLGDYKIAKGGAGVDQTSERITTRKC